MNKPSKSQVLYERNMELQKAYAEVSSLTEQRDHWQQQTLSKSELVAALEAAHERNDKWATEHVAALEARCLLAEKQRDEALSSEGYKDSVLSDCSTFVQGEYAKKDKRIAQLEAALRRISEGGAPGIARDVLTAMETTVNDCGLSNREGK